MEKSESIGKLSEALSKAQGMMKGAVKDADNPFFKSKYADLASVWDACREPLSSNGLSVAQTMDILDNHPDMVVIETIMSHTSGEWIKGRLALKPVKNDPQAVGSAITYGRRYSLQSIVGIAPEDDDGNAASGKNETAKTSPTAKGPTPNTEPDVPDFTPPKGPEPIQDVQKKTLGGLMKEKGLSDADQKSFFEFTMDKDLTKDKAQKFIIGFDTAYETWQRAIKGELV